MNEFELVAEARAELGSRASRRLRRRGKTPAILYGADKDPMPLLLEEKEVKKQLENEAAYSHVLTLRLGGAAEEQAVLKALQRHPRSSAILHMDFQRVRASETIAMHVPLHFVNEDRCPGKRAGGIISHLLIEAEVSCLPKDLPEFIEVDMALVELGQSVHLSELTLPSGVEFVALAAGREQDPAVVTVQPPRGLAAEAEEGAEPGTESGLGPAAGL
ncbi:MAG: 50S ribosomal protein L25/general stress protein Ctc [Gammaproteobacteria bacterium]|jgi:large subunit ribosomal protein L25